MRVLYDVHKPQ